MSHIPARIFRRGCVAIIGPGLSSVFKLMRLSVNLESCSLCICISSLFACRFLFFFMLLFLLFLLLLLLLPTASVCTFRPVHSLFSLLSLPLRLPLVHFSPVAASLPHSLRIDRMPTTWPLLLSPIFSQFQQKATTNSTLFFHHFPFAVVINFVSSKKNNLISPLFFRPSTGLSSTKPSPG